MLHLKRAQVIDWKLRVHGVVNRNVVLAGAIKESVGRKSDDFYV